MMGDCEKINLKNHSAIVQDSIILWTPDIKYLIALN